MRVTVVDYGMGNLGSIVNMLRRIGHDALVTSDPVAVAHADKLVLPGVGTFDAGMQRLNERGLVTAMNEAVLQKKIPMLGMCLGLQLMARGSEEGKLPGLAWINAEVVRFDVTKATTPIRVPHMGWNTVAVAEENKLIDANAPRFYFVHSFHLANVPAANALATTNHGYDFVSAVRHENIYGVQFHPEKSHRYGMRVFQNFVETV